MNALQTNSTAPQDRKVWYLSVALFLALLLWPLWSQRFPAMQDYPQHLFQSHVLREYNNPAFDYSQHFDVHLRPVYATFFLLTQAFAYVAPIEIAGKLALSVYPLLIAWVVVRLGRRIPGAAPWGALLFFPFAFNQQYFLGNLNYLFALPLLVLALLDFEDLLTGPAGAWPLIRHLLWQAALFITHPFAFDVFAALAVLAVIVNWRQSGCMAPKALVAAGVAVALMGAAWVVSRAGEASQSSLGVANLPLAVTLKFFLLMFNGMQSLRHSDWLTLLFWAGVAGVTVSAYLAQPKEHRSVNRLHFAFLLAAVAGFLVLPFRMGAYTYVNFRTAAAVYFFLALLAARIHFTGWRKRALIALAALCTLTSVIKQSRLSREVAEIAPAVRFMPPNARFLPVVFDNDSPELDPVWFDPHLHDHDYYHVLVGGGYNPYLLVASLHPVHYQAGQNRSAPPEYDPTQLWHQDYTTDYDYLLLRKAPDSAEILLKRFGCRKIRESGAWTLFATRNTAENSAATVAPAR